MPGDFDVVKERVDIVQVIGERVALKRAGRIYKALCPFHAEKTPSFTVDPERRTYKCFGCGEFGDVFTFLEKTDGLSPAEALERLAERAGVELTRRRPEQSEADARLYAAQDVAYFYFRQALRGTPAGKAAASYLEKRGLTAETVERFGLGFAPDLRDGLLTYLRKKGYTDDEAVRSGLVVRTERGELIDRFRGRVIVPTRDARGRTIAFGGRSLADGTGPKYLNSPATALFDKSSTLFALDVAKPAIRKSKEAIVVEGYFDAIAAHQAGIANAVASMGTSLTRPQFDQLLRFTGAGGKAVIVLDADPAGQKAAEQRGQALLDIEHGLLVGAGRGAIGVTIGLDLFVAVLPAGMDPDALVRQDPERFRQAVADSKPVVEFLLDLLAARHPLATPVGRRGYLREAVPILAGVSDRITRAVYLDRVAARTGVPGDVLEGEIAALAAGAAPRPPERPAGKQKASPERYVVAQLLRFPDQAGAVELSGDDLSDPELRPVLDHIRSGGRLGGLPTTLQALAAELLAEFPEAASAEELVAGLEQAALRVREQRLRRRLEEARGALARSEPERADELDALLAELKRVTDALDRRTILERVSLEEE